jgi:hypothetical protein
LPQLPVSQYRRGDPVLERRVMTGDVQVPAEAEGRGSSRLAG